MLQDEKEGAAAALASPAQNINRLIELIRCSYKSSSGFSFPTPAHWLLHRDQYLEDVELKNGKTYRLAVKFEKDILNYRTKKATAKAENGFAWYPFDGFRIGVKEGQQESFEQYLFPNTGTWESQLSGGAQLIEGLVSSRKVDEAVDMLYETSNCVLSALAYQTKFKLLENIANRFYQEDRKDYGAVELLTSIARSKTESTQFYEDVKSSPEIVTSLYIGTDDEYTTQKYINCLVVIFANYWDGQEIKVSEEKHFLKYSNGLHTAKSPNVSSGDKKLSFTKWKVDFQSWAGAVACNPMEPVGILHATTQNEGEDVIKYVPAMYLLHVDKEKRDQNTIEFVAGAANIAATFTGAGLVYKGTSAIQKVVGMIELANAATSLVLMDEEVRRQVSSTQQGIAFLEAWPTISIAADLATLSVASLDAFSKSSLKVLDDYAEIIPELERKRIKVLADECKIVVANGADIFKGARQSAIARFGKQAEDLIYIKFNKNSGAAAEIIDHYGQAGLNALKKASTIDGAASELVKNKIVYRAVNETTYNFEKLKKHGIIEASPVEYPTYVSLDNYTDANVIQQKLQLPRKPTWVAEFDGNQIVNDVRIPNGKFLKAEYKEVLCRSYPEINGIKLEGGGSQLITNSEIKINKLINLETGEVVTFSH